MRFWATCALGVATVAGATAVQAAGTASTIVDIARSKDQLSTLLKVAEHAGLADELKSETGPLTLLAPSDQAFAALGASTLDDLMQPQNSEQLARLLKRHIVADTISYEKIKGQTRTVSALDGTSITFDATGSELKIDGEPAILSAQAAGNGVVIVLDRVLAN